MMSVRLSKHAEKRINQRGFQRSSAELIRRWGTPVMDPKAEVYFLRNNDVDTQVRQLKREIHQIERLRGCKAVFADDTLVTIVRTGRNHKKALLRRTV
jgi:hypothetical protein